MKNAFSYNIFVLGCQQNVGDAEKIELELQKLNGKKSNEKSADLIITLACSVRQRAFDRLYSRILKWREAGKKIIILACVLPADRRKIEGKVDLIIDTEEFLKNPKKYLRKLDFHLPVTYNLQPTSSHSGFVTIQLGCDNFCSFCAVPYTRGRERSVPENIVLSEVKELARQAVSHITLLGENVNSYGKSKKQKNK